MKVALRKESVDRNLCASSKSPCRHDVALRKESVDRNIAYLVSYVSEKMSLSARRAWIEIYHLEEETKNGKVALRKESVDRNKAVGEDL